MTAFGNDPILDQGGLVQRNIKTDRYGIRPTPRAAGARVDLTLVRRAQLWELNGEPMETAGEVIANIGLVMEHLDREAKKRSQAARKANASRTPEQRSDAGRKAAATRKAREREQN